VNAIIFHNIVNYRILFKIKLLVLDCVEILKGKSLILKQKNWETLRASLIIQLHHLLAKTRCPEPSQQ